MTIVTFVMKVIDLDEYRRTRRLVDRATPCVEARDGTVLLDLKPLIPEEGVLVLSAETAVQWGRQLVEAGVEAGRSRSS